MKHRRSKLKQVNERTDANRPITEEEQETINNLSAQFKHLASGVIGKSQQKATLNTTSEHQTETASSSQQHWYGHFGELASFNQPVSDNDVNSTNQKEDADCSEFLTSNEEIFNAIRQSSDFPDVACLKMLQNDNFDNFESSGFGPRTPTNQRKKEQEEDLGEMSEPSTSAFIASTELGDLPQKRMTRKKLRELVEKHMDRLQEAGERAFKTYKSLKGVNSSQKETINSVDFVFKLVELCDGGILVKAHAILPSPDDSHKIEMNFSSCVFIEQISISHGKLAMKDAIGLLPDFIDGNLIDPVSEFSTEYFNKRFIFKNDKLQKRFENFSLFCRLCELHVKSPNFSLDHVRCADHNLLKRRYSDRYYLCRHWHSMIKAKTLKVSDIFVKHIYCLNEELKARTMDFYKYCPRDKIMKHLEALENSVKDYVIKFELFGSYESSLLSCEYPIIDCYISIKRTDSSDDELSYAEKLKVFEQLPFKNSKRFETAFLGYLVEWRTKHFKEKFFFTMDPKASNAVLSSRLMALYVYLAPPILDLALVFREWVKHLKVFQSSDNCRVSGAIFDYMVVYFMQKYYGLPVIDESMTKCSLEEFLNLDRRKEISLTKPHFDAYFEKLGKNISLLPALFMNLLLYFGCGFNYKNVVQITSVEDVKKENNGFRTVKIMDPITPTINLFHMRPEHAFHLDNMIFFACCEFLQPPKSKNYFERISVEHILSSSKDKGYPFLVSIQTNAGVGSGVNNSQMAYHFKEGLGIWDSLKIPHIPFKCHFCCRHNHTESLCKFLKLQQMPDDEPSEEIYQTFSTLIGNYHAKERIDDKHFKIATDFIANLQQIIETKTGNKLELQPFGSLKSGFGSRTSDFDLCITQLDENTIDEKLGRDLLLAIGDAMLAEGGFDIKYVFGAKVPILTFNFSKEEQTFKGDISFSNLLALHNTKLLESYTSFDVRVAPLGLMIKRWANAVGINSAASHSFSSYALSIMLLHFLQRVEPPVLPNLQDINEFEMEKKLINGFEVQFAQPSADYCKQFCKNEMSLGELFVKFFDYFGSFNWSDDVVQIRAKDKLLKMDKGWHRAPITIEDPFDLNHNLTACIRSSNSLFIFKCFNIMQLEFRRKKDCIFLEEKFDFDSESFKDLMSNMYNSSKTGISCHKCGEMGHHKSSCTKEVPRKEPGNASKSFANSIPIANSRQQPKSRSANFNQMPPMNQQRNYQQMPPKNQVYPQQQPNQRIPPQVQPAGVFFPKPSRTNQVNSFFQQPPQGQPMHHQQTVMQPQIYPGIYSNNSYAHQPMNAGYQQQAMPPPQANIPNHPQYTFFNQPRRH